MIDQDESVTGNKWTDEENFYSTSWTKQGS